MCENCERVQKVFDPLQKLLVQYANDNKIHPMDMMAALDLLADTLERDFSKYLAKAEAEGRDISDPFKLQPTYVVVNSVVQDDGFVPEIKEGNELDNEFNAAIFTVPDKRTN